MAAREQADENGGWTAQRAVKTARTHQGQTRKDLAEALAAETGKLWTAGMVTQLERRQKHLTIEILIAIAKIQRLPLDFYAYGRGGLGGAVEDIPG